MRVAVFVDSDEVLIVGLDKNDNPVDIDGTLFGPNSGRCLSDFDRYNVDFSKEIVQIRSGCSARVI